MSNGEVVLESSISIGGCYAYVYDTDAWNKGSARLNNVIIIVKGQYRSAFHCHWISLH